MKKFVLVVCVCASFVLNAAAIVSKTVSITAGALSAALTVTEKATITNLTVTGTIDARDLKTMRDGITNLSVLNISAATVSAYTGKLGTDTISTAYAVNEMPKNSFRNINCSGNSTLKTVVLPNTIASIGAKAFEGCIGLTGINIPASVKTIGSYAFYGCKGLAGMTIPNTVTSIGSFAFTSCTGLTSLTLSNNITSIADWTFGSCTGLTSISLPSTITSVGSYAFYGCAGLTGVTIPTAVTLIGESAFSNCTGITNMAIPVTVTTIGNGTFANCSGLAGVTIPNTMTSIGDWAFVGCTKMTGLTIPNVVKSIGYGSLYGCTGLTSTIIPDSVKSIGDFAYGYCSKLASISVRPITPIVLPTSIFSGVSKDSCTLNVPTASKSAYQAAAVWNEFLKISEPVAGHFTVAFTGNGQNHMNLNILTATLDGVAMEAGDEIAAFDNSVCCGKVILKQPINVNNLSTFATIAASKKDIGLSNGFTEGDAITYKFWDASLGREIDLITSNYIDINTTLSKTVPTYTANSSAFLKLSGTTNRAPIANAGTDQIINERSIVTLNGSTSSDADGNTLTYIWIAPAGITLSSTTAAKPTFTAPDIKKDTPYTFSLVVNDGMVNSSANQVVITVKQVYSKQKIDLSTGWNMISLNVNPLNANLKDIVQPLINSGKLVKVMDESGKAIENFATFGGWNDGIGNFNQTEGYMIDMTESDSLILDGVDIPVPMDINLSAGWNIISYPCVNAQSAMTIIQPLIDAGTLKKVMDESGNSIEDFGSYGGWKNNIGNFNPGKSFKINITTTSTISITSAVSLRAAHSLTANRVSTFFTKVYEGNGNSHMNINLVDLTASPLKDGDEIGIYDGKACVGSAMLGANQIADGSISVATSCNDLQGDSINGFTPGHAVTYKLYSAGKLYNLTVENLWGSSSFEKNGSLFAKVLSKEPAPITTSVTPISEESIKIECYPNPFVEETTIDIQNTESTKMTVEIYSFSGKKIKTLYHGIDTKTLHLTWDGTDEKGNKVAPGAYIFKINDVIRKIIFSGKK